MDVLSVTASTSAGASSTPAVSASGSVHSDSASRLVRCRISSPRPRRRIRRPHSATGR
nr:MAG TPA: hypothetical protein [Caudoviricetes sp.]